MTTPQTHAAGAQVYAAKQAIARGNIQEAGRLCEAIVALQPDMGQAWFLLGFVHHRMALYDAAISDMQTAIRLMPFEAGYHAQLGEILMDAGKVAEAETCFRSALQCDPREYRAYNHIGLLLFDAGRLDEAIDALQRACELRPDFAIALNNLGVVYVAKRRFAEAQSAFARAIEAQPDHVSALNSLAKEYVRAGNHAEATAIFLRVVALTPERPEAHFAVADCFNASGRFQEALAACRTAIRLRPSEPRFSNWLGELLWHHGDFEGAVASYRHTLNFTPGNLFARIRFSLLLPVVARDKTQVHSCRANFSQGLACLEAMGTALTDGPPDQLEHDVQWTNFYLAYQGENDRILQVRYAAIIRNVMAALAPEFFKLRPEVKRTGKRIRVGFASFHFYDCTVGRYFRSWVTDLDPERFEVVVYHLHPGRDALTDQLRNAAAHFHDIAGNGPVAVARSIAAGNLDILIYPELGMFPLLYCLASMRLATVQCVGWGHPVTTGHENIDHFISCAAMEPHDAADHYSENLAMLPGLGTRYPVPRCCSKFLDRPSLGLPAGRILYLIPQSIYKIHPDNDSLIARILVSEPRADIVMFRADNQEIAEGIFHSRLQTELGRFDSDLSARIVVLPRMCRDDYLRVNQLCDVMLDTLHWSGGNTSLDAIASGLPIVTLPGRFMRGRQSAAMLKMIDCIETIVTSTDDYVELALRLGRDQVLRNRLSARMAAMRSRLFDQVEPLIALQDFLQVVAG